MFRIIFIFIAVFIILSCNNGKRYHDKEHHKEKEASLEVVDSTNYIALIEFERVQLDKEFKTPETSPLSDKRRQNFDQLNYYSIDSVYRVKAYLELTPNEKPFLMTTTTDRKSKEVKFGILHFELLEKKLQLNVYKSLELSKKDGYQDYLFLPFTDNTNGEETYGGGRYLDLKIPKGDSIIIDFNKAYNPYCAYNKKYSCPIVPSENHLDLEIKAGVKVFK